MEQVEGFTLSEIIDTYRQRRETAPLPVALEWMQQACRAVQSLHAAGAIHGTIAPGNIVIDHDERLHIAGTGNAVGGNSADFTSDYLAPEQRDGRRVDGRADLYSLGATFYELLTLARPVPPIRPPTAINPAVPPDLEAILCRLLDRLPENRYQTAEAVLDALQSLKGAGPGGHRALPDAAPGKVAVPRLAMIVAGGLLGAAMGAAAGYFLHFNIPGAVFIGSVVGGLVGTFANPNV